MFQEVFHSNLSGMACSQFPKPAHISPSYSTTPQTNLAPDAFPSLRNPREPTGFRVVAAFASTPAIVCAPCSIAICTSTFILVLIVSLLANLCAY